MTSAHVQGKWHLGFYTNASCPWERGFGPAEGSDFGYLGGEEDYWTKRRDVGKTDPGLDFRNDSVICRDCQTTDQDGDADKYSTKLFRVRAVEKIAEHAARYSDQPMFLYMPFQAVHAPLASTPHWQSMFDKADFDNNTDRWTMAASPRHHETTAPPTHTLPKHQGWLNKLLGDLYSGVYI